MNKNRICRRILSRVFIISPTIRSSPIELTRCRCDVGGDSGGVRSGCWGSRWRKDKSRTKVMPVRAGAGAAKPVQDVSSEGNEKGVSEICGGLVDDRARYGDSGL